MSVDRFSRVLNDYYRCPEGLFDLALRGQLSSHTGYFGFGPTAICYGRTSSGRTEKDPASSLWDAREDVAVENATLELPFDLSEIVDNLRMELYPHRMLGGWEGVLKRTYYLLRPLTNRRMRQQVQKYHARGSLQLPFPRWPVDTTVETLVERVLFLLLDAKVVASLPFVWFWPRGDRGCVVMTHDVETIEGRDFCKTLLDIDESFGIRSSYQLVPEARYQVPPRLMRQIRSRGCEITVHDLNHDGRLFDNREEFLRRAGHIRHYAKQIQARGFRSAVLYRKPEWLDDLGCSYDMSIPNVAHLDPQLGGCCTVMPYFIGNTLELPVTTIQDYALFYLLNERSVDLWRTQVERIFEKNGMATFIVHPDYVIEQEARSVYEELLRYLQTLRETTQAWFALPGEVNDWWRLRSRMSVVKDGNSWRIEGEGSENAVLAHAKCIHGQLAYELADGSVVTKYDDLQSATFTPEPL